MKQINPENRMVAVADVNKVLAVLLRAGVILSMVIVLIGGLVYLIKHNGVWVDYSVFKPELNSLSSIGGIFKGVLTLKGDAIVQFGILLLIFTPIARIIFAMISFFVERDYLYLFIGLIILAIISVSLTGGLAH